MTAQDVRTVLRSSEWQAIESRNPQVVSLCEFAETEATAALSTNDNAKGFIIILNNLRQIRDRGHLKRKSPHGTLTLDAEQEADVVCFIRDRFGSQNDVTERGRSRYAEKTFHKVLTYGWMKNFWIVMKVR
jgi:hypothetical protein